MSRLTSLFAVLLGLGFAAPGLAATQNSAQSATQQDSQSYSQNKMQQSQFNHPGRMVIGEVIDTRGVQIKGPAGDKHRLIKLDIDADKDGMNTVVIDLGAMSKKAFQDLGINSGNRIWALGSSARINGKPVIYARYVGEVYNFVPNYQGGQKSTS